MRGVLVVAEHRRGQPLEITHELIAAGLELAAGGAGPVSVVAVSGAEGGVAERCGAEGVIEVVAVHAANAEFEPHATQLAVEQLIGEEAPSVVLVGHTPDGMGFAPALAAKNRLGFASNVLSVDWGNDGLTARRAVYGDRLVAELEFDRPTVVVMVRPGAYAPAPTASCPVRDARVGGDVSTHRGYREADTRGVDITSSDFLLSIGRGIGGEENVERFAVLAAKLGATLSASRPLVDAGWLPSAHQVGQSGRTVKPKIYLALGISGAVQHLAGIREAETVIAVNTDPEAPIFKVAEYGAVIDLFDLADELEDRLQSLRP